MNGSLLKPLNRYLNGSDETKPWGFNLFSVNLTEYQSLYIKKKKPSQDFKSGSHLK